jgi:alpha/beta superfamily hydrolase
MSFTPAWTEQLVTLPQGIVGRLTLPQQSMPLPAVLLLHGFGNHKDEVGDLFIRLAAALATTHIASLRIDFRGWGESAGDMADTTIERQVEDAQIAYSYLTKHPAIDVTRLGLLGFSAGAAIAVVSSAQLPASYKSLVLWSSVLDLKADCIEGWGQDTVQRALHEGIITIDLGWRTVTLKDTFFRSLERYHLLEYIRAYPGALLVIAGSEDTAAKWMDAYKAQATGTIKETLLVEGADHIFNVLSDDQTYAEYVIEKTVQWIGTTL